MHSRLVVAVMLVFWLAGCKDEKAQPESRYANEALEPGADHPLAKKLEELRAPVRLRPDGRFTLALSRIGALVTGEPAGNVVSRFESGRWTVFCNQEKVGDLPVYPDFDHALLLLRAWSGKLLSSHPLPEGKAGPPASLEVFPVESAQELLRVLDADWVKARHAKLLRPAVRASVAMVFQMRDFLQVSDEVAANALALVALAGAAGSGSLVREEAMLAEAMGYSRAAKQRAEKLEPDDPLRAFILKDDPKLEKLAGEKHASVETGYLWLMRVIERRDYKKEEEIRREVFKDHSLSLSPLGAHLDLLGFWQTEWAEQMLPWVVIFRIRCSLGKRPLSDALYKKLRRITDEEQKGRFNRQLKKLEEALDALGEPGRPSLYDAGIRRAFFRAFAYSGLYRTARFYLCKLSSRGGAAYLWDQWEGASTPLGMELREWYALWIAAKWGDADAGRIVKALSGYRHLGVPARVDLLEHLTEKASWGSPAMVEAAGHVLPWLDSRVEHRLELVSMAYLPLNNMVLLREALESAVQAAPDRHYWMEAWHARLSEDAKLLEALLEKPDVRPRTKANCLIYLKEIGALKPEQILERFETLSSQHPENWSVQKKYIKQLEADKKYQKGREVASKWLEKYYDTPGLDSSNAIATIGRLYRKEGKPREGLGFLEPHRSVERQYGPYMAERALLLADLGRHREAREQVQARMERYPAHTYNIGLLARVLWVAGRHGDAARMLKQPRIQLQDDDWRWIVGDEFNQVFQDRPAEEGMKAIEALKQVGIEHTDIMELAAESYNKTNHELAFSIYSGLDPKPWEKVRVFVRAYLRLKKVLGEPDALEWLESQIAKHWRERLSILAYNEKAYELLWTLVPGPDREDDKADFVWLMRAAAACLVAPPDPKHREILYEHYEDEGGEGRPYHQYGRFLLGKIGFRQLLGKVKAPDKMIEIAYYTGLKAQGEGRLEEASDWYQVAFSLGDEKEAEYRWSYNQLYKWRSDKKYLPRAKRHK